MSDLLLFSTCRVTSLGVGQEPGAFFWDFWDFFFLFNLSQEFWIKEK